MTNIAKAILAIKPDAQVSVNAEDLNQITWHDGNPTNITNQQITDKQAELQTEYNNLTYARARKQAYPSVEEFMEAYTEKEILADTGKWDEYVIKYNKVRSDNPK
jgi:hypothetical protein